MEYKYSTFSKYPKLILLLIVAFTCLALLTLTEYFLKRSEYHMVRSGKSRYVVLKEPIPNKRNLLSIGRDKLSDYPTPKIDELWEFNTDNNGFIEPYIRYSDSDFSIVFLGDATTACLHLDSADRFSNQVGILLKSRLDPKINTYNAGNPGNDIIHSVNRLIGTIIPLKPDYILLMHSLNDLKILSENNEYWNSKKVERVNFLNYPAKKTDLTKSIFLKNLREDFSFSSFKTDTGNYIENNNLLDTIAIFRNYQSALTTFIMACKNWGIEPILMTQANQFNTLKSNENLSFYLNSFSDYQISENELMRMHKKLNTIIINSAKSYNIKYIDIDQVISNQSEYFQDAVNFNKRGSRLVAELISDSLSSWIPIKLLVK
jgi:lysophospholipase L1-like esterase